MKYVLIFILIPLSGFRVEVTNFKEEIAEYILSKGYTHLSKDDFRIIFKRVKNIDNDVKKIIIEESTNVAGPYQISASLKSEDGIISYFFSKTGLDKAVKYKGNAKLDKDITDCHGDYDNTINREMYFFPLENNNFNIDSAKFVICQHASIGR